MTPNIKHLPEGAQDVAAQQGWNDESLIVHLLAFIAERSPGFDSDLAGFFREVADEENAPMPRYNHAYDFAFEVLSDHPEGEDVTPAMLRACKGRGNDCLIEFDNGEKISLSSFSGGAAPEGIMGSITLLKEGESGKTTFRTYKSVTDWQSGLQEVSALEPAPDHSEWNAALEEAAKEIDCGCDGACMWPHACPKEDIEAIRNLKKGRPND